MHLPFQRHRHETVEHCMSRTLHTTEASDTLVHAADVMSRRKVGAVLVLENEQLIGIMTERDVLRAVGTGDISGTVGQWMTHDPITVGPDATHGEAAMMMIHGGFRHVPIVDGGKLVGIVSIRDLLILPNATPAGA